MDDLFFFASKIAWGILSPGNLIIIFLVLGVIFIIYNRIGAAKTFLVPAALFSFILMIYPIGDFAIKPLEEQFSKPEKLPKGIHGIIVLGGGEDLKRSISWATPEMNAAGDRYVAATYLAKQYRKNHIYFTGGSGSIGLQGTQREAHYAKKLLNTIGVPKWQLKIESQSRNTFENFRNVKTMLPTLEGRYLLVTSAFHMPRSVGIARQQGIDVIPYPVDFRSSSDSLRSFGFSFNGNLDTLEVAIREWIGLTVYYLTGKTSEWFPSR